MKETLKIFFSKLKINNPCGQAIEIWGNVQMFLYYQITEELAHSCSFQHG